MDQEAVLFAISPTTTGPEQMPTRHASATDLEIAETLATISRAA
jgi:hypothetical protein